MSLEVRSLAIADIKIISPKKHGDSRGFFSETYNKKSFAEAGIHLDFVQDNQSLSERAGTLRGLHYQGSPFAQDKLVRVVRGRILDVAVDIRRGSQILVPIGFAHAICTLEPNTELIYKVTNYYAAQHDFGIRWNDPHLNITWPFPDDQIMLSDKDKKQPFFEDVTNWL
jgi:dTDP-4-dehydrorhamnose 3,5-epimerase